MASSANKTVLYSFWRSSCAYRVRIALNFKEIPYEIKPISIIKGAEAQHTDEYHKINPMERVPALRIDGVILIESLNILQYLEETRKDKPLLPKDVVERARVREICEVIASGIQPLQNIGVLEHLDKGKRLEWTQHWIQKGFGAVEQLLSASAGKHCVGDQITMADCCLIPQIYNARKFRLDLTPYPNILRIEQELEHPAFLTAHPCNQPDCPAESN